VRATLAAPLVALSFLTVVPAPAPAMPAAAFPRAVAYFPLVGAALGVAAAAFDQLARAYLAVPVAGALDLALLALLSGGLHLDGLADASDGLLPAGRAAPQRLAVMRSGSSGAFGVVAVVLALLIEFGALAALGPGLRAPALIASAALSRWTMALALWAFPYVRPAGLGRAFKDGLRALDAAAATILALLVAVAALGVMTLVPTLAALLVTLVVGMLARRRIGGVTGDVCGAIGELSFASSLVALSGVRP
jgi:adenosylcobinamide-GDP ribazoletransferase